MAVVHEASWESQPSLFSGGLTQVRWSCRCGELSPFTPFRLLADKQFAQHVAGHDLADRQKTGKI